MVDGNEMFQLSVGILLAEFAQLYGDIRVISAQRRSFPGRKERG